MANTEQICFNTDELNFNDELNEDLSNITLFSERNGRKTNTYILDWNIDKEDMKTHLRNLKRKYGCNGSIKIKKYQGEEKEAIHLQGELKMEVKEYLISNGIEESKIEIKV